MRLDDLSGMEQEVLDQATEDWTQLWELAATSGSGATDDRITLARAAVKHLLDLGLIELARDQFPTNDFVPVPDHRLVDDRGEWDVERSNHLVVEATDAGRDVYFGR